ncbi:hypothetical protein BCR44DRAFT_1431298 [Catenaria anguillulae PL171]|uniref:Uncharacterized protein n=1 Tax=Catenaria anguillulae PL171 TaxID=765915 RepID=A0A1Y2HV67_9FUNG|nr:hypothetical protein BCR44DRAFT_1431298 [Catenaria anguillulae PL171]
MLAISYSDVEILGDSAPKQLVPTLNSTSRSRPCHNGAHVTPASQARDFFHTQTAANLTSSCDGRTGPYLSDHGIDSQNLWPSNGPSFGPGRGATQTARQDMGVTRMRLPHHGGGHHAKYGFGALRQHVDNPSSPFAANGASHATIGCGGSVHRIISSGPFESVHSRSNSSQGNRSGPRYVIASVACANCICSGTVSVNIIDIVQAQADAHVVVMDNTIADDAEGMPPTYLAA